MPSFDENNLTPEELRGGFDAESSDDDAFSLDDKKEYPGSMPDLSGEETPQEKEEDSAGGSVWDLFESDQSDDEIKNVDEFSRSDDTDSGSTENDTGEEEVYEENNEQEPAEESTLTEDDLMDISGEAVAEEEYPEEQFDEEQPDFQSDAFSEEPPAEELQDFQEDAIPDDGELPDDLPTFDDIGEKGEIITDDDGNADEALSDAEAEQDEEDDEEVGETIEIDEDLRNLIEEEIERGKTRRVKQEEALKKGPIDLPSLEEINSTEDESGMVSYRPGGISEPQPIKEIETPVAETKEKDKKKKDSSKPPKPEKPAKPVKEKVVKEKKQRGPLPWYYLGLSAAMFAFTAIGFGSYYFSLDKMILSNAQHIADIIFKPDTTYSVNSKVSIAKKITQKPAVEKHEEVTPVKEPESTEPAHKKEKNKIDKHGSKDLLSNTKQHKPSPDLHGKVNHGTVTPVTEEEGVYTVQVYSTLSREDAEEWYGKLLSKSVQSPFITRQVIRDKILYRVRFGKFSTREEAHNAAVRCGFAQSWIDRVK